MKKATLDRLEDGQAIFLIHPEEVEWQMAASHLPQGLKEGDEVFISDDGKITYSEKETEQAKDRIAKKLSELRKRQ
ncbi:DUF3006 domain-containing protein [Listeria sp. PSOL-1]|uniref:DUF3006 domain-containing protein n=1 Tax=Listeria sp. PSOL-1 TaxID=1844999 RepID=UPI0013CF9C2C|nr:DUF3006 domain-containing protein [Listeria sp. PSOL-1]